MKLWWFECQKMWGKLKLGYLLLVLIVLICGAFFYQHQKSQQQIEAYQNLAQRYDYPDPQSPEALKQFIAYWQDDLNFQYGDKVIGEHFRTLDESVKKVIIKEAQLISAEKITPLYPLAPLLPENYQQQFSETEIQNYYRGRHRYYDQGWLAIYGFLQQRGYYLIYVLVILLFGTSLADEKGRQRHYRFMQMQGKSLKSLYFAKFFAAIGFLVAGLFLLVVVLLGFSSLVSSRGALAYPVLTYHFPSAILPLAYDFMPLGTYLFRSFWLILSVCAFLIAFCYTLSRFTASPFAIWSAGSLLLLVAEISPAQRFNPLFYFKTHQIVTGLGEWYANCGNLSWLYGVGLFAGLILSLLLWNYFGKGVYHEK